MSAHSDILGPLTNAQLEDAMRLIDELIRLQSGQSVQSGQSTQTYALTKSAIQQEMDSRYVLTISAHHALQILSVHYPDYSVEDFMLNNEYDVRTMWNERAKKARYPVSEAQAHWKPETSHDYHMHSSQWPPMRPLAPLAIVHRDGETALFTNAAPPVNVWWAAEDRILHSEPGTRELVWREWRGEVIHEGWVMRVKNGFMHYLTRYKDRSPLPLRG